jgi:hypothetical protein
VDANPHIRLSVASVELPDGKQFEQYVFRMPRCAMTDATPQAVADLLADPRVDHNRQPASEPAPAIQDHFGHLGGYTGSSPRAIQ